MATRGRILSDPTAGPGRVMVQGRQHAFGLDSVWQSEELPRPGVVVDVEFDDAGRIRAMMAVPEARLVREQVEAALAYARSRGADLGSGLAGRFGLFWLAALTALAAAGFWFFLHGAGIWLLALASAGFALAGLRRFLLARAEDKATLHDNE